MNCRSLSLRLTPRLTHRFPLALRASVTLLCLSVGAVLLSPCAWGAPTAAPVRQQLRGHVPAVVSRLQPTGTLPPTTQLHLAIGLPLRDQQGLSTLLQQIYDPSNPNYRHYLTPEQFTALFGPTEEDYKALTEFARTNGLIVSTTFPTRMVLDVTGTAADVEKAFHTTLRTYSHPTENREFFAPDIEPSLDLGVSVLHISGLDNFSIPHPASLHKRPLDQNSPMVPNAGSGPQGTYMGNDFRNAYMPGVSTAGEGQIVGLLEFDGYYPADITSYEQQAGLAPVVLENVFVDGFNGTPGPGNGEVALDIEVVVAMAPKISKIIVYQAPNPSPTVDLLTRMASDTQVKQFSSSWGGGSADPTSDQVLQQMAAQGQSVFCASGDSDAYTGEIAYPSDSPYLTSVGGTTLTTDTNGAYSSEQVWNVGGGVGSSGGISTTYPIPSWQLGFDTPANFASSTLRNIPDVALTADNIFIVADNGNNENVGGTSAASPLWAAVMALANQQAGTSCGSSIGFLNPIIYGIGKGSSYATVMNDIIKGNNFSPGSPTHFPAVVGYDSCTGWGSPKPALLERLVGPVAGALPVSVQPLSGSSLISTDAQPVFVTIPGVTNATVFATIAGSSTVLNFLNDGQPPDLVSNDSVYSAMLQVPQAPGSVTLTLVALATGRPAYTNTLSYGIVPPALNDNFANATKVPVSGASYVENNRYATIEHGEPLHDGDANMAGSLWWAWTPTANTSVLIDSSGSRVENVLAVYTGSTLAKLQQVAATSSDIAAVHPSRLSFNAQAGQAYYIALASATTNSLGSLHLSILPGAQPDTSPPIITVTGPQSGLTVSNQIVTVTGTAADAGNPATGLNKIVVTVNGCEATTATGTTSWAAPISLQPELNIIQAVAYDESGNASPPVTIELVYFAVTPGNDFFAQAAPLLGMIGTNSVDTSNATKETGEPDHAGNSGGKSVWWFFSPPVDGVITLSTEGSTFDTLLAVYTGDTVSGLSVVGANDDAFLGAPGGFSLLNQAVHANVVYYVALDGYGGAGGPALFSYSFSPAQLVHVTAGVSGSGTVQLATLNSMGGKAIQPTTIADVASGTTIVVTPTPGPGYRFDSWQGVVSDFSSPLSLVASTNLVVTAHFVPVNFSDDFESGTLSHLSWTSGGTPPWIIESTNVSAGGFAARSAAIGNNQSSSLILTTNFAASTGSFDFLVSSEINFDLLKFFIDGSLVQQWSGQAGWTTFSFPMTSGIHTLEWRYVKDPSGSAGLDAAFIDNVSLPILLPKDSTTPAHLGWVQGLDGNWYINLAGQASQQYILQTSTDLVHWQNVSTTAANSGLIRLAPGPLSSPAQFYRAVVP